VPRRRHRGGGPPGRANLQKKTSFARGSNVVRSFVAPAVRCGVVSVARRAERGASDGRASLVALPAPRQRGSHAHGLPSLALSQPLHGAVAFDAGVGVPRPCLRRAAPAARRWRGLPFVVGRAAIAHGPLPGCARSQPGRIVPGIIQRGGRADAVRRRRCARRAGGAPGRQGARARAGAQPRRAADTRRPSDAPAAAACPPRGLSSSC